MKRQARGLTWVLMGDVVAYLYFIASQGEPGDATWGRQAFERLRCGACHAVGGNRAKRGTGSGAFTGGPPSHRAGHGCAEPRHHYGTVGAGAPPAVAHAGWERRGGPADVSSDLARLPHRPYEALPID
jgi:hypothetical protein